MADLQHFKLNNTMSKSEPTNYSIFCAIRQQQLFQTSKLLYVDVPITKSVEMIIILYGVNSLPSLSCFQSLLTCCPYFYQVTYPDVNCKTILHFWIPISMSKMSYNGTVIDIIVPLFVVLVSHHNLIVRDYCIYCVIHLFYNPTTLYYIAPRQLHWKRGVMDIE